MPVSGTLLNALTVLIGGTLGLLVGGRLPERFQAIIFNGLGLATMLIGVQNALKTSNILILLAGILLGGLIGELLRLDFHLDNLGNYLQRRLAGSSKGLNAKQNSTLSEAFVTSSLIFCVGPLTILGSIENGINGDISFLALKSMLDGFAAFAFAASLGWGVLLSTVTILIYQGALSLAAWGMMSGVPSHDNSYILEMTAAGGLIIVGVGLRLLNLKELKLANYLPALAVAPAIVWVVQNWPF